MNSHQDDAPAERSSMASTKADFRELRTNTSATVQELQEFLSQLRGKSPQEMLGIVASSQLFRAIILSLILVTTALFALTAIPYFFGGEKDAEQAAPASTEPAAVAAKPTEAKKTSPASDTKPKDAGQGEDLAPLKVNDTKTAPPNVNPLEDKGDDFLKDLE